MANARFHPPLTTLRPMLVRDTEDLAATLANPDIGSFEVESAVDRTVQELRLAISRFCQQAGPKETLLLHYSGHGIKDAGGRLYLGAADTEPDLLAATGLDSRFLMEQLSDSRSRTKIVILDCGYAGAVLRGVRTPDNVAILAAAGPLQYAFEVLDGELSKGGSFTATLTDGLRSGAADLDGDGKVTVEEVFSYGRRKVEAATEGAQTPRLFNLLADPVAIGTVATPIFLSYSRSDTAFAARVRGELIAGGHRVWMDTSDIVGGDDWVSRISAEIQRSKLVLAIITPEAVASPWVRRELGFAQASGKPLLPLVHKTAQLPAWYELQFGETQRLELTENELESGTLLKSVGRAILSRTGGLA